MPPRASRRPRRAVPYGVPPGLSLRRSSPGFLVQAAIVGRKELAPALACSAFKDGLLAVVLVPLGADLDEPESGDQAARGQILRAHRRAEPPDRRVPLCPAEHGDHGLSRVPASAVWGKA